MSVVLSLIKFIVFVVLTIIYREEFNHIRHNYVEIFYFLIINIALYFLEIFMFLYMRIKFTYHKYTKYFMGVRLFEQILITAFTIWASLHIFS